MTLLKIVDNQLGRPVGTFNWFPIHGTSMSQDNKLISGDNKGAASRFMEDWFWQTTTASNHSASPSSMHSKRNMSNITSHLLEFTTMAGRRLREAVKETLIANGSGEYSNDTHIVIAGLTNAYSQYVATFEEYQQQRYEGASTLYGPHTLSAYIQEFQKLAKALAMEVPISDEGPSPPDLSSKLISTLPPVLWDMTPHGVTFGDVKQDVQPKKTSYNAGDVVSASFWSANPRNDLLTEGTFSVVEHLDADTGKWNPAFDDDDFSTLFMWNRQNGTAYSYATIQWKIPITVVSGIYRMRHFGAAKQLLGPVQYLTGISSPFHAENSPFRAAA